MPKSLPFPPAVLANFDPGDGTGLSGRLYRFDASDAAFCEAIARLWVEGSDKMEGYDA